MPHLPGHIDVLDPNSIVGQGQAAGEAGGQGGLPPLGMFDNTSLGILSRMDTPGNPALGGFRGVLGLRGRREDQILAENLDVLETFSEQRGLEFTDERREEVNKILRTEAGFGGAGLFLEQEILNQPENLAAIEKASLDASTKAMEEQALRQENIRSAQLANEVAFRTGGLGAVEWSNRVQEYGEIQGDLDLLDDLLFMNQEVGAIRTGAFLEGEKARLKGAYDIRSTRLVDLGRKIIEAGALQPAELTFLQNAFPDFGTWSKWTKGQREAMLVGVRDWILDKAGVMNLLIPNNPIQLRPGQHGTLDEIMGFENPTLRGLKEFDLAALRSKKRREPDVNPFFNLAPGLETGGPTPLTPEEEAAAVQAGAGVGAATARPFR